jgi:hypothetical protein
MTETTGKNSKEKKPSKEVITIITTIQSFLTSGDIEGLSAYVKEYGI